MQTNILNQLKTIERQKGVAILYAVESGSRAWGFASPDSDYDIRFIYKHDLEYYLSLWDKPDTIEFMTTDNLDGSGWDLRKTVKLLAKSNAPLLEWLYSPVVYYEKPEVIEHLRTLATQCFSPIACTHHYIGTTKTFMPACQQEQVKLKSYFYALRSTLAAQWILECDSIPPVAFSDLLPLAPASLQDKIQELLIIKATQDETYLHPKESLITDFLESALAHQQERAKGLRSGANRSGELDGFFRRMIK
ncbi:nucleotidyltransferase domain-containing protein [Flavobacterium oreochromis]|uniref:Nucleotidyltransferase n=1 Tax=Flavobacterium columnare TaxID=996 RepID=A0A2D0AHV9_9FLAO|nr:nucleotidyltransferase domain-containing protein [Flavobacterium oreochromis]OWP77683.1 nucleotidyltransferase [Flavobacterium oreochromis]